jgi:hypothetical protein
MSTILPYLKERLKMDIRVEFTKSVNESTCEMYTVKV